MYLETTEKHKMFLTNVLVFHHASQKIALRVGDKIFLRKMNIIYVKDEKRQLQQKWNLIRRNNFVGKNKQNTTKLIKMNYYSINIPFKVK